MTDFVEKIKNGIDKSVIAARFKHGFPLLAAGLILVVPVSSAVSSTDLTRPQALEALKKTVNFENDSKCLLEETMKKLIQFKSKGVELICSVEKVEITGIAKANPNEPIVEYDVVTRFDPLNLKQLLGAVEKQKKYYEDLHNRYMRDPVSLSEIERILALDARGNVVKPGMVEQLEEMAKVVRRLANEPIAARKAQSQFRLYDDGWRVIKSEWQGYSTRKLTPEELSKVEQEMRELKAKEREVMEQKKLADEAKKPLLLQQRKAAKESLGKEMPGMDGSPMLLVPAGEFLMGSKEGGFLGIGGEGNASERPQHRVYLDAFYMDQFEVTTSRYAKFLEATGRKSPDRWNEMQLERDKNQPVIGVDWNDADAYCRWAEKRLPTEAEWEKSARGTDGRTYPWGNEAPTSRHAKIGEKQWQGYTMLSESGNHGLNVSPYGIHDMAGNVWEWVADWYDEDFYRKSPDRNPLGPAGGTKKVLRGGSLLLKYPYSLRSTHRNSFEPAGRFPDLGFRCAEDAKP